MTAVVALAMMIVAVTAGAAPVAGVRLSRHGDDRPDAQAEASSFEAIAGLEELTDDHAKLLRLYWAFFNRPADPGGAIYWIEQRDSCVSLDAIADVFAASDEFIGRYGLLGEQAFVELIYQNVLDRSGDAAGLAYWTDLLVRGVLSKGGVVLNISLSSEVTSRHPYPSDGVADRSCRHPDGRWLGRNVDVLSGEALATVAGLTIAAPATIIEQVGFHESSHPGALGMSVAEPTPVRSTTMASRRRGTHERSALDITVDPSTTITSPVAGTVARAGAYTLYCRYSDGFVVINPDGRPDLEVKILHIQNVAVAAGQRVEAGDPIATHATTFAFRSQIDDLTAEPSWPHVHIEVVDPSIPRRGSSGSC